MSKRSKAEVRYAIDLLWTHQVRRENAFLRKEIESLREEVKLASAGLNDTRQTAFAAQRSAEQSSLSVSKTEKIQHGLASAVNDAAMRIEDAVRQSRALEPKLEKVKEDGEQSITTLTSTVQQLDTRVVASDQEQKQQMSSIHYDLTSLKQALASKAENGAINGLTKRVEGLQEALIKVQESQQSPGIVVDSIQDPVGSHGAEHTDRTWHPHIADLPGSPKKVVARTLTKLPSFLRSSTRKQALLPLERGPPEEDNLREDRLTLQPKSQAHESVEVEDLDLDENVNTMSYVRNMDRDANADVIDSMPMLPSQQSIPLVMLTEVLALKQGRLHSWERYLVQAENLFKRLPRHHEKSIAKAFVEGIFDDGKRRQCQQWLNLNGWTWAGISSFAASTTPALGPYSFQDLASEATRVPSPAKVHFRRPKRTVESTDSPQSSHSGKKALRSQVHKTDQNGERRRSQRLARAEMSQNEGPSGVQENQMSKVAEVSTEKNAARSMKIRLEKELMTLRKDRSRSKQQVPGRTALPPAKPKAPGQEIKDAQVGRLSTVHKPSQRHRSTFQKELKALAQDPGSQMGDRASRSVSRRTRIAAIKPAALATQVKKAAQTRTKQSHQKHTASTTKPQRSKQDRVSAKDRTLERQPIVEPGKVLIRCPRQEVETPSTPVRQKPLSPFQGHQPAPRLVKRKRAASREHRESEEEIPLPRAPRQQPFKESRPFLKKSRLPLPPPPAIPILPTSED